MTMLSSALESAKATRINLFSLATTQMRTFHLTWFAFFCASSAGSALRR